ncbi:hypothetical protein KKF84_22310 [Myxococcota bacterium]|nr:hypothetical protein [Myxococcota bacterium]MBU1538062.1 hypothetical protein [Myxococcota bacterium]
MVARTRFRFPLNPLARRQAEIILRRLRVALDEIYGPEPPPESEGLEEPILALIHRMEKIIRLEEAKEAYNKGLPLTELARTLLADLMRGVRF